MKGQVTVRTFMPYFIIAMLLVILGKGFISTLTTSLVVVVLALAALMILSRYVPQLKTIPYLSSLWSVENFVLTAVFLSLLSAYFFTDQVTAAAQIIGFS